MRLKETSLINLIPEHMRSDRTIRGMAAAWDYLQSVVLEASKLVSLFDNLEMLPEEKIDEVAQAIQIPWYDSSFEKKKKIQKIRNYEKNCYQLGTVAAVNRVVGDVFKDAQVLEWYEYGGKPCKFKITVPDQKQEEDLKKIGELLRIAKNAKATMEGVEFRRQYECSVSIASCVAISLIETSIQAGDKGFHKKMDIDTHFNHAATMVTLIKFETIRSEEMQNGTV